MCVLSMGPFVVVYSKQHKPFDRQLTGETHRILLLGNPGFQISPVGPLLSAEIKLPINKVFVNVKRTTVVYFTSVCSSLVILL